MSSDPAGIAAIDPEVPMRLYQEGRIRFSPALAMTESILHARLTVALPWADPWKPWDPAEVLGDRVWYSAPLSRLCAPEGFVPRGTFGQPLGGRRG